MSDARSALVPGYGQYYAGHRGRAIALFSLSLVAGSASASLAGKYSSSRAAYDSSVTTSFLTSFTYNTNLTLLSYLETQAHLDASGAAGRRLTTALGFLGAVYLFGLVDAYFFAVPEKPATERSVAPGRAWLDVRPEGDSGAERPDYAFVAGYTIRF